MWEEFQAARSPFYAFIITRKCTAMWCNELKIKEQEEEFSYKSSGKDVRRRWKS